MSLVAAGRSMGGGVEVVVRGVKGLVPGVAVFRPGRCWWGLRRWSNKRHQSDFIYSSSCARQGCVFDVSSALITEVGSSDAERKLVFS